MSDRSLSLLFLGNSNSSRTILAEALLRSYGEGGHFRAFSTGIQPEPEIHPIALELIQGAGLPTEGLYCKELGEFTRLGAPRIDGIISLYDSEVGEICPLWPGRPPTAQWHIANPARVGGSRVEQLAAFKRVLRHLENRVRLLICLRFEALERLILRGENSPSDKLGA